MINRRDFLLTTTTLILSSLLSGCEKKYDLDILLLQESIPIQLINAFKEQLKEAKKLNIKPEANFKELYNLLLTWQGKNEPKTEEKYFSFLQKLLPSSKKNESTPTDLITLSNYYLTQAIQEELITPLDQQKLTNWQNLPSSFQNLVIRNKEGNFSENGQIWAAPYRWGYTMIAYRQDKFESSGWQPPQDWDYLWKPEIRHKFSLLNQPREIIGLTLKKLGYSYNTELEKSTIISELKSELKSLHQQVKFYDSQNYLQPLILGDTWLTVGWSNDILPIVETYKNIAGVIPLSGTALWADLWVNPKNKQENSTKLDQVYNWIDFCWQPDSAKRINLFTNGISPINAPQKSNPKLVKMSDEILMKSEFIEPLSQTSEQFYDNLWQEITA